MCQQVSLIIATKGRPEILAATLEGVRGCNPGPAEVIVVDGDERQSARRVVEATSGDWPAGTFRYLPTAPGLTRQRNRGVDAAVGDIVVFLDDDVEVKSDLFVALVAAYDDPSVVGATGLVIEDEDRRFGRRTSPVRRLLLHGTQGTMTSFGYPRRLHDLDQPRDVEFMQGCLMSGRRTIVKQVRFDESLSGYGLAEDEDFSFRLSRRGRVRYVPNAVVMHKNAGFRSSDRREINRVVVVNRTYLFRKNFAPTMRARIGFAALIATLLAHRLVNGEYQGVVGLVEGARDSWRGVQ